MVGLNPWFIFNEWKVYVKCEAGDLNNDFLAPKASICWYLIEVESFWKPKTKPQSSFLSPCFWKRPCFQWPSSCKGVPLFWFGVCLMVCPKLGYHWNATMNGTWKTWNYRAYHPLTLCVWPTHQLWFEGQGVYHRRRLPSQQQYLQLHLKMKGPAGWPLEQRRGAEVAERKAPSTSVCCLHIAEEKWNTLSADLMTQSCHCRVSIPPLKTFQLFWPVELLQDPQPTSTMFELWVRQ